MRCAWKLLEQRPTRLIVFVGLILRLFLIVVIKRSVVSVLSGLVLIAMAVGKLVVLRDGQDVRISRNKGATLEEAIESFIDDLQIFGILRRDVGSLGS